MSKSHSDNPQTTKVYAPKNRKKFHNGPRQLQHDIETKSAVEKYADERAKELASHLSGYSTVKAPNAIMDIKYELMAFAKAAQVLEGL